MGIKGLGTDGVLRIGINLANILLVTGRDDDGAPLGVARDMADFIAGRLGAEALFVPLASPGLVADALGEGAVDIGLIAQEPERAKTIAFTRPYVEIEATYLVPEGSDIDTIAAVDSPGRRIAVSGRSAYDLYLSRTLEHAELVRGEGLAGTFEMFVAQGLDVLAGLRPALIENAAALPGARLLDGRYMTVEQAVGCVPGNAEALAFLEDSVAEAKRTGLIAAALDRHGVAGKLQVAAL